MFLQKLRFYKQRTWTETLLTGFASKGSKVFGFVQLLLQLLSLCRSSLVTLLIKVDYFFDMIYTIYLSLDINHILTNKSSTFTLPLTFAMIQTRLLKSLPLQFRKLYLWIKTSGNKTYAFVIASISSELRVQFLFYASAKLFSAHFCSISLRLCLPLSELRFA